MVRNDARTIPADLGLVYVGMQLPIIDSHLKKNLISTHLSNDFVTDKVLSGELTWQKGCEPNHKKNERYSGCWMLEANRWMLDAG